MVDASRMKSSLVRDGGPSLHAMNGGSTYWRLELDGVRHYHNR